MTSFLASEGQHRGNKMENTEGGAPRLAALCICKFAQAHSYRAPHTHTCKEKEVKIELYAKSVLPHQNFEDNMRQYTTKGFCCCPRQKDQSK